MSKFNVKITKSKLFEDVKVIQPEPFYDYRGEMWTFWERKRKFYQIIWSGKFQNLVILKKCSSWIHGDDVTWKHISCVYGEIYFLVVDNDPILPHF